MKKSILSLFTALAVTLFCVSISNASSISTEQVNQLNIERAGLINPDDLSLNWRFIASGKNEGGFITCGSKDCPPHDDGDDEEVEDEVIM